jgi:signal transduction histidine kinase
MCMKLRKPKHLYFQLFGILLIAGAIALGYYQYQWISSSITVEKQRILKEMYISTERALDKAYDEIRALITFSYLSPVDFSNANWEEVNNAIAFWKAQSPFPDLLANILIIPTIADEPFLSLSVDGEGFVTIAPPPDFDTYKRYLSTGSVTDALRRAYPPLISKGYFMIPLSNQSAEVVTIAAFLAIQINTELFYTKLLPIYLDEYLGQYTYRISESGTVFYSTPGQAAITRQADMMIPVLHDPLFSGEDKPPRDERMENPISRFWVIRRTGIPGIAPEKFDQSEIRRNVPMLEIYHADRSLDSVLQRRMVSSLLLSIGTLIVLLAAYFVLYMLLRRADKLRSREHDFVTSMSHELRTPLSVISATSDNLVRGIVNNPDRVKQYGSLIQTQSQRLGKMVESILFFSGMESMDVDSMEAEGMTLSVFFEEIVQNLAPTAEEAGARIVLSKDTRIDEVQSYPNAIRIITENLIVNALHHGTMDNANAEVRLEIRTRPPRWLFLIVEDDGPGIPQGEIKRIFEPFARGERSRAEQVPGSGLGLHIVRRVSTQLGGQVTLESPYTDMAGTPGQGTRFTVKIPIRWTKP